MLKPLNMPKVITFSKTFPRYHPKVGESTFFVEKIYAGLGIHLDDVPKEIKPLINDFFVLPNTQHKIHTIRAGRRWKLGDKFSPRIWSGKAYSSKQLVFSHDLEIKSLLDFEISNGQFVISGKSYGKPSPLNKTFSELAKNDGLTAIDLMQWFADSKGNQVDFEGQIISWLPNISY